MFREALAKLAARIFPTASPAPTQALIQQAAAAFGAARHGEAARFAEQATLLDPTLAPAQFLLGAARLELREFAAAEAAFAACLALKPAYPAILHAAICRALTRARAGLAAGRTPKLLACEQDTHRRISIVICSNDSNRFARVRANYDAAFREMPHEVIGIHDASSLCEGYNRGAARASGEYIVFSHDDVEIVAPDFAPRLVAHLARHDLIGVAGTTRLIGGSWVYADWPHLHGQIGSRVVKPGSLVVTVYNLCSNAVAEVEAMDGVFLAMRREVMDRVRFDEDTFDGWHLYDLDFTLSAHLAGFRMAVCNDLRLIHNSMGNYDDDWRRYMQRFEDKHRANLRSGHPHAQQRCSVEVASPDEWALMTEEMIAQANVDNPSFGPVLR